MARSMAIPSITANQGLESILKHLPQVEDVDALLHEILDVAIEVAGADMGTLQCFDETDDCLRIVASRGFPDHALKHFEIVRRDSNSSCAAALKRRMRVIVDDVATSYLFVGRPELDLMREIGVAAAHSTPLIGPSGRLWGVFSTYFRQPQPETRYDPAPLDRLAVSLADCLEGLQVDRLSKGSGKP
jgi:GAF domain-containing protein